MRRGISSSWRLNLLLAGCFLMPPACAIGQTASSSIYVSASVVDSCSANNAASSPLSVTCMLGTPVATDSVTATPATAADTTDSTASNAAGFSASQSDVAQLSQSSVAKQTVKLCNNLASSQLENSSFNQYIADMDPKGAAPQRYFSTFQICF